MAFAVGAKCLRGFGFRNFVGLGPPGGYPEPHTQKFRNLPLFSVFTSTHEPSRKLSPCCFAPPWSLALCLRARDAARLRGGGFGALGFK